MIELRLHYDFLGFNENFQVYEIDNLLCEIVTDERFKVFKTYTCDYESPCVRFSIALDSYPTADQIVDLVSECKKVVELNPKKRDGRFTDADKTWIDEAISQSEIGVALVAISDSNGFDSIGYIANEDYYSDLMEDMANDFVAYDGVEEFEDMYDGEGIHITSVQPLTLQMIEDGVSDEDGHQIYKFTSNQMVERCGCEAIAFQLSNSILIVRGDQQRLILRTDKKLGDFTISELPTIIKEHCNDFAYPNDEGVGVIEMDESERVWNIYLKEDDEDDVYITEHELDDECYTRVARLTEAELKAELDLLQDSTTRPISVIPYVNFSTIVLIDDDTDFSHPSIDGTFTIDEDGHPTINE